MSLECVVDNGVLRDNSTGAMTPQRKQPSNIGLRRRQPSSQAEQRPREIIRVSKHTQPADPRLTNQGTRGGPAEVPDDDHLPLRDASSRLGSLRRAELVQRNYGSAKKKATSKGYERDESDPADHQTRDSSDESSPIILINPSLEVLPVAKTEQAKGAFDFYVNSYATSIIEVSPQNVGSYSNVVHQILHDELLFSAFTTCSEAARWRTQSLYGDAPLSVAKGYGKTIDLLSQRLKSERFAMSPAVLLTMGQLVAIETMMKNVSATARHLAGMQAAMKPKGKVAPLKGSAPVQTATDIWTQYFVHRAMIQPMIPKTEPLIYPEHPFNPKLSMQIADLPAGFSNIALSGRLSTQMLELLELFNSYFTQLLHLNEDGTLESPERTQVILRQAAYCIEYHQIRLLSIVERLVLTALTAYVVRRDRIHPALVNIRNYFQIVCAYQANLLSSSGNNLHQQDQGSDLLTWVGLTLLLTSSPEAHARKLALRLLPKKPEPLKILAKCRQFFWDDDLTNALLSGNVVMAETSNDIIADNIRQALPEAED